MVLEQKKILKWIKYYIVYQPSGQELIKSHSVQFTSTSFPFGAQLVVANQGEHMIFVPLGLA